MTPPYNRKQKGTEEPLDQSEIRVKKLTLNSTFTKLNHGIWSHHFMATKWGNSGNNDRLYWGGASKITTDGDNSHVIKRCLLFGRKAMTNLVRILKSRAITLQTKVHLVKAMVFPAVIHG